MKTTPVLIHRCMYVQSARDHEEAKSANFGISVLNFCCFGGHGVLLLQYTGGEWGILVRGVTTSNGRLQ